MGEVEHARQARKRFATLGLIGLLGVGVMAGLGWLERAMLYPRQMLQTEDAVLNTPGLSQLWLETDEGRVEAWLLPGDGVDTDHPGPAVIFAHGNGELIDYWPDELAPYRRLGVSLVLPEYRGYGRSAGRPTEAAIGRDLRSLHALLSRHPLIDTERIVYHGRSLGGGAVCTMLPALPPKALVLESTFTALTEVSLARFVPSFLLPDRYESLDSLRDYGGPTLVLHGRQDELIPVDHGRRLHDALSDSELDLYDAGHNDLPREQRYWSSIEALLRRAGVLTQASEDATPPAH